jgi:hypothetical protein
MAGTTAKANPSTRATMIWSIYQEIVVRGAEFASVRLTPEAYAHGLAVALPQEVLVPRCAPGTAAKDVVIGAPDRI